MDLAAALNAELQAGAIAYLQAVAYSGVVVAVVLCLSPWWWRATTSRPDPDA